ncbi:UNVERIFIED_CONTAM: hypothetical protein K2H54_048187 [Gekko kuhli]
MRKCTLRTLKETYNLVVAAHAGEGGVAEEKRICIPFASAKPQGLGCRRAARDNFSRAASVFMFELGAVSTHVYIDI